MPTIEQYTRYLREHYRSFTLAYIADFIGMDRNNFQKAVKGLENNKGRPHVIPDKCLPKLSEYFNNLNIYI